MSALILLMPKPKRNGPCPCGSDVKYKKCCENKDMTERMDACSVNVRTGEPIKSEKMLRMNQYLLDRYQMRAINLTNSLSNFTFNRINSENAKRNVVVVAERTETNESVFVKKGEESSDMILLYKANYLCFNYEEEWDEMIKSLDNLIRPSKTR